MKIKVYEYEIWGDEVDDYFVNKEIHTDTIEADPGKENIQKAVDDYLRENLIDGLKLDNLIVNGEIEAGGVIYVEAIDNVPVCEFRLPERVPSPFKRKEVAT